MSVSERRVGQTRFTIDDVNDRLIATFAQRGVSADALRRALQPLFDARAQVADAERQLSALTAQVTTIATDQDRVRENIKALGSSREQRALIERYTHELNAQEDRLDQLQEEVAKMTAERDSRRVRLSQLVQQLTFEVTAP
jgi:chromosome segregation ATPase